MKHVRYATRAGEISTAMLRVINSSAWSTCYFIDSIIQNGLQLQLTVKSVTLSFITVSETMLLLVITGSGSPPSLSHMMVEGAGFPVNAQVKAMVACSRGIADPGWDKTATPTRREKYTQL